MIRAVLLATLVLLLLAAAPAAAFDSCVRVGTIVTATFGGDTTGTLKEVGGQIHTENGQCAGAATTANTERIDVVGDDAHEILTIDLAGGTFAGGATGEGVSGEVEIEVDLGPQSSPPSQAGSIFPRQPPEVIVLGSTGTDAVTVDTFGPENDPAGRFTQLNLNAFESPVDQDVTFDDRRFVEVRALGGADDLSALAATGSHHTDPLARLVGGPGNDELENDYVVPGPGDDTIRNVINDQTTVSYFDAPHGTSIVVNDGPGNEVGRTVPAEGGDGEATPGADVFLGSPSEPQIIGSNNGVDRLDATARVENAGRGLVHFGAGGNDVLTGSENNGELLLGGEGNDTLDGAGGDDGVEGGPGNDTLTGGDGGDDLVGGPGDDDVFGGPDADFLHESSFQMDPPERAGPNGADDLNGGADHDFVLYGDIRFDPLEERVGRTAPVTVDLDDVADDGAAGEGDNVHADVEQVHGGFGADTLSGNEGFDVMVGLDGADLIDVFGGGADAVLCGDGGDKVHADESDDLDPDCETVERSPRGGAPADPPPGPPDPAPPADPPPAPPPPVPTPPAPPAPTPPAAAPKVATLLSLQSTRRCASRRKFTVRVRREIRGTVKRVQIFLNGRRVKSVTGSRIGLPIDLRGLPKGKIKVRLRVELTDGRVATDTRTYRTCATKKRKGRFG